MPTKAELQDQLNENQIQLRATRRNRNVAVAGVAALGLAVGFAGGVAVDNANRPSVAITRSADGTTAPATPDTASASGTPGPENNTAAQNYGKDAWSQNQSNWGPIVIDGVTRGYVMAPNPDKTLSVVDNSDGVGQGYIDARMPGNVPQAIALVLEPGITMPVRGESIYGGDTDVNRAFEGALKLELNTQRGVYVAQVCKAIQAVPGNEQDVTNPPQWQAQKITAEQAAKYWGRDAWSMDPSHWSQSQNGDNGMVLEPNPNGTNSVVEVTDGVGQAYWDANVKGQYKAIAVILQTGTQLPVRGFTGYYGVPAGMGEQEADFATKQAVNLEIQTQPGVYVVQVCKTEQAVPGAKASTETSASTSGVVFQATPEPTTVTTTSTPKPESTPISVWYSNLEYLGSRLSKLPDGGEKIKAGPVVTVKINGNEKIIYWNGVKVITQNGPATVKTGEATVYQK